MTKKIRIKKGIIKEEAKNNKLDQEFQKFFFERALQDISKLAGMTIQKIVEEKNEKNKLEMLKNARKNRAFDLKRKESNETYKSFLEELAFIYCSYINVVAGAAFYYYSIQSIKSKKKPENNQFNNLIDILNQQKEKVAKKYDIDNEQFEDIIKLKNKIPDGSSSLRDTKDKEKDTSREDVGNESMLSVIENNIPKINNQVKKIVLDAEKIHSILSPTFEVSNLPFKTKELVKDAKIIFESIDKLSIWVKKLNDSNIKN
jgi:hypothetical protein